ncbi:PIR protein [Plasmodium vivax]|uniref:VIR protein n=1 Tax=Plasmodium vivax TaxID=5855 RepID=A0A565A6E5_PLAVI|nr:PIR protein [Plasmodium vivax]
MSDMSKISNDASIWNDCISCVWNKLENTRTNTDKQCKFESDIDSFAIVQIKKIINDVCLIAKEKDLISDMSDREKCLNLNKLKHYYLHVLLIKMSSIPDNSLWEKKHFNFGDGCSMKTAYDFLQEKPCPTEVKKSCPEPEVHTTLSPKPEQYCSTESCFNLTELRQKVCPSQSSPIQREVIQPECPTLTCKNVEQICPQLCTKRQDPTPVMEEPQGNSNKNPLLQVPVTLSPAAHQKPYPS